MFEIAKKIKSINPKILIAIDNTYLTPLICKPLTDCNIDIVFQSGSVLGGHNDSTIGVVSTNDENVYEKLCTVRELFNTHATVYAASQTLKGMKTLELRLDKVSVNAIVFAE